MLWPTYSRRTWSCATRRRWPARTTRRWTCRGWNRLTRSTGYQPVPRPLARAGTVFVWRTHGSPRRCRAVHALRLAHACTSDVRRSEARVYVRRPADGRKADEREPGRHVQWLVARRDADEADGRGRVGRDV